VALKPCITCGRLSAESYCPQHRRTGFKLRPSPSSRDRPPITLARQVKQRDGNRYRRCGSAVGLRVHHVRAGRRMRRARRAQLRDLVPGLPPARPFESSTALSGHLGRPRRLVGDVVPRLVADVEVPNRLSRRETHHLRPELLGEGRR
jgi:hypothetical protein